MRKPKMVNVGYSYKTEASLQREWRCGYCGYRNLYPYDGEPSMTCPVCGYIHGSRPYRNSPVLPGFAVYK